MSDQPNPPSPLAAVLLAAGMSRRMGQPKALLDLGGKPLILHVVKTLETCFKNRPPSDTLARYSGRGVGEGSAEASHAQKPSPPPSPGVPGEGVQGIQIFVITGHRPELIHQALEGTDVRFVHNPAYETGQMLSSVKAGAAALPADCQACFLVLLDQPLVRATTLETLARAWMPHHDAITLPSFDGGRGHPILISARCIPEILNIPESGSLRDLVERYRSQTNVVEVNDPGIATDLDTPEDYQRILAMGRSTQP